MNNDYNNDKEEYDINYLENQLSYYKKIKEELSLENDNLQLSLNIKDENIKILENKLDAVDNELINTYNDINIQKKTIEEMSFRERTLKKKLEELEIQRKENIKVIHEKDREIFKKDNEFK